MRKLIKDIIGGVAGNAVYAWLAGGGAVAMLAFVGRFFVGWPWLAAFELGAMGVGGFVFTAYWSHRWWRERHTLGVAPAPTTHPIVITASEYPQLLADTKTHLETKVKEQQEMNKSLRSALRECHGALDAGVKSGQGLKQEIVKITKERDGLKESQVSQQRSDGQVRQLRLELETTKLDLKNLQNVTRYGEANLSTLSELTDSEQKFLQRDMHELTTWVNDAHSGMVRLRHQLLGKMFAKGESDTARHLAILIQEVEDPITTRLMTRFFEQATVGRDSREALTAACSSYAKRKKQLSVLAGCLNCPVESLEGYKAWREADEKYEEVLRDKLEKPYLRAVKMWWYSSANGGEPGSWILSE